MHNSIYYHRFTGRMENKVDPNRLASRKEKDRFSRTMVKTIGQLVIIGNKDDLFCSFLSKKKEKVRVQL